MTKKYFKYILFSILVSFAFITSAKAISCQYEIPLDDKGSYCTKKYKYAYVRLVNMGNDIKYNPSYDTSGKYYFCLEESKQGNGYVCNEEYTGWLSADGVPSRKYSNYSIGMYGVQDIVESAFADNMCNTLRTNLFPRCTGDTDGYSIELYGTQYASKMDTYQNVAPHDSNGTTAPIRIVYKHMAHTMDNMETLDLTAYTIDGKKHIGIHYYYIGENQKEMTGDIDCEAVFGQAFSCPTNNADGVVYKMYAAELEHLFTPEPASDKNDDYWVILEGKKHYISAYSDGTNKVSVNKGSDIITSAYKAFSNICEEKKVKNVVKFIGFLIVIIKILIPLGLIIFGAISFAQAMISGESEDVKKSAIGFLIKFIAAVVIFAIPTILNYIINIIDDSSANKTYTKCTTCLFDTKNCK